MEDVRLALKEDSFANAVQESIDALDIILEDELNNLALEDADYSSNGNETPEILNREA